MTQRKKIGKHAKSSTGHGGNVYKLARQLGCAPEEIMDFSANINPYGFPEGVRAAINHALDMSIHYPDTNCTELTKIISHVYGCAPEQTIVANGTTEIIHLLPKALNRKRAVIPTPSYIDYAKSARLAGMTVEFIDLLEEDEFAVNWKRLDAVLQGDEVVYLARPNNPTGTTFETETFLTFAKCYPNTVFVVDEAYVDFAEDDIDLIQSVPNNVIVTLSLTKFYGIPGLRLGFAVAAEPHCSELRKLMPAWSVNNLAQAAGIAMLQDDEFARATRELIRTQRTRIDNLSKHGDS